MPHDLLPVLLHKLIKAQLTHQLALDSQTMMTVLATLLELNLIPSSLSSEGTTLLQRVERIEKIIFCLVEQFATLNSPSSLAAPNRVQNHIGSHSGSELFDCGKPQPQSNHASIHRSVESSNEGQSHSTSTSRADKARSSATYASDPSVQQSSVPLSLADWTKGVTTNCLVVRLNTNPTTLKKYVRDLHSIQWAVERDPDGLGWTYDPLLERYYPVQANARKSLSTEELTTADTATTTQLEIQTTQEHCSESQPERASCELYENRGGLTQSQFSRLTAIPITTLQRWKELPDCSERIRCRTEGAFIYWYCQQNRRFYPARPHSC